MENVLSRLTDSHSEAQAASEENPFDSLDENWILSIEDDDDIALSLDMRLSQHGIQVVRASAGMEGYRRAFTGSPRVILLDYELPEGNGAYVLRRLKESPATSEIPVIVLTGHREGYIERQMRNLGANDFLTKPINWKQLVTSIESV